MTITNPVKKSSDNCYTKVVVNCPRGKQWGGNKDNAIPSGHIFGITQKFDNFSSVCLKFFVRFETNICNRSRSKRHRGCIPKCIYCNRLPLRAFRCCMTLLIYSLHAWITLLKISNANCCLVAWYVAAYLSLVEKWLWVMGILSEGKDMQTFNISANVIRDNSTKLILSLRESRKGVNNKD